MIEEEIIEVNKLFIWALVAEISFLILIKKSGSQYKFRFGHAKGHPNLNPYIKYIEVAIIMVVIFILAPYIEEVVFGGLIRNYLEPLGLLKNIFVSIFFFSFTTLWFCYYILEKDIDRNSIIPIFALGISLYVIFFT